MLIYVPGNVVDDVIWSMRNLTENRKAFIAEFEHHVQQKRPVYLKVRILLDSIYS